MASGTRCGRVGGAMVGDGSCRQCAEPLPGRAWSAGGQPRELGLVVSARQWNVLVDISQEPDNRPFTVNLLVNFWNGFQKPDARWSGFRILHSTEDATYRVIFPPDLPASSIKFQYKDITSNQSVDLDPTSLSTSPKPLNGQVSTLTWKVQNPQPDRSYRIYWSWPTGRPRKISANPDSS
jgi:hypothetical protein